MKTETSTEDSTTHSTTLSTTHSTSHSTSKRTTHSTTSHKPNPVTKNVVLITGGWNIDNNNVDLNATLHSAEIFSPNSPPCILPDLPAPYHGHTQDKGMICGGADGKTLFNCRRWNSDEGKFPEKPVHEFKYERWHLVSWTPVYEKETFLMGGSYISEKNQNTSTKLKPGEFLGKKGFDLKYPLFGACAIPYPENGTVIITGGNRNSVDRYKRTSVYNETGYVGDLENLNDQRWLHGCTSYVANNKRIFLVTGGRYSITTETLQDKKWTVLKYGNLPLSKGVTGLYGLQVATVNNNVFSFGGTRTGNPHGSISSIFKFNIAEREWHNQSYHMSRSRFYFGISVVDFKYYSKACLK